MAAITFSKVIDAALKVRRRSVQPLVDGSQSIQELGVIERKVVHYFWIMTNDLQKEIAALETEAAESGWVIEGEPARVSVQPPLDLYNVTVAMMRLLKKP